MTKLQVYKSRTGDYVAARSSRDAERVYSKWTDSNEAPDYTDTDFWIALPDTQVFTIFYEENDVPPELAAFATKGEDGQGLRVSRTCSEWAQGGRRWLGSNYG